MNSPFTDFVEVSSEDYTTPVSELESMGPFSDEEQEPFSLQGEVITTLVMPGLNNLSNKHNIDVKKAVADNRVYEKRTWGAEKMSVLQYLQKNKIIQTAQPLSEEHFAYAVADFQASRGLKVDGILGPITWATLKVISTVPSVHIPAGTTGRSKWHAVVPDAHLCYATPLVDGKETFASMVLDIRSAGEGDFIYIMGWMLDIDFDLIKGDPTTNLYQLLKAAIGRKAEVRVLVWHNPDYLVQLLNAKARIEMLTTADADASMYLDDVTVGSPVVHVALNSLNRLIGLIPFPIDKALDTWSTWKDITTYVKQPNETSHHEKIVIVKSSNKLVGYCGGVDINRNRLTDHWDTHCRFDGRAAWELLERFKQRWKAYTLKKVSLVPTKKTNLKGEWMKQPGDVAGPGIPYAKIYHTYNGSVKHRSIREHLKAAIEKAETSIYMEDQYMVSCEIAGWLNEKLRTNREFSVTIVTENDEVAKEDLRIPRRKRAEFIKKLSWNIPDPSRLTIRYTDLAKSGINVVHSKIYIIDPDPKLDGLAIIGSANCNRRSMTNDTETAAFIFGDSGAGSFASVLKTKIDAHHPQSLQDDYRYPTTKNTTKDKDTEVIEFIDKIGSGISFNPLGGILGGIIPHIPGVPSITSVAIGQAKSLVRTIFDTLWEVIDPNPDNIVCTIPGVVEREDYETGMIDTQSFVTPQSFDSVLNGELSTLSPFNENEIPYPPAVGYERTPDEETEPQNFYESSDEEMENVTEMMEESFATETHPELFSQFTIDPSKGTSDYLNVSTMRGLPLKTGVFVPSGFTKTDKLNIIVYLHGLFGNGSNASGVDSYWNTYTNIREYFAASNRNALMLVPGLSTDPQSSNVLLNQPKGFDNFLDACLAGLKAKGHVDSTADFEQIIIAGHSAGGRPLSTILASSSRYLPKVVECWGFDCLYADWWADSISKWATGNKIFYHYWAWSCSPAALNKCPRVIGDKFQATNPSNFENIETAGRIGHQQIIERAWLSHINTRSWFGGSVALSPAPAPALNPAFTPSSDTVALHTKMGLAQLGLSLEAFTIACNGYRKLDQSGQLKNNRILSIGDFTQSSNKRRLYILDMASQKVLINTNVAHGHNGTREWATKFSNTPGSHMSSLGFYVTQETFTGKHGLSLRLNGLEQGFNNNARARAIIVHTAPYVHEDGPVGQSWGCPVVPPQRRDEVINTIKNGTCFFIYFNDPTYLSKSLLASAGTKEAGEINSLQFNEDFESDFEQADELHENYEEESNALSLSENEAEPVTVSPVPFAPLPPAGSYWPLVTNVKEGKLVSYTTTDGKTIGYEGRKFKAGRSTPAGAGRHHIAIDLFANFNDPVVAVDDGKILSFNHFYTSNTGHATNSLVVQHSNVIVNYGEVGPSSFPRLGLKVGDNVRAGQIIGFVGATAMLHFETYKITGSTSNPPPARWMAADAHPPANLYNPTKYLLYLKEHGLVANAQTITVPAPNVPVVTPVATPPASQWQKAISSNRNYQNTLGWSQYYDKINDLLLPFSGLQNVSLGEEAFARAVAAWQTSQGFASKDCDGIIGPNTWAKMKGYIIASSTPPVIVTSPGGGRSLEAAPAVYSTDKVPAGFIAGTYSGWHGLDRKSILRVDEAAKKINADGSLSKAGITEIDIDTFQRIANAETGGKMQNFYSYDLAIVSIGFRQFTLVHGNLHEWIKKVPAAFRRYGIEIDETSPPYVIKRSKDTYTIKKIKGVDDPESMRWNGFAQRFYYAGLDYDIVIAEFILAKEFFARELGRLKAKLKSTPDRYEWFMNYYNQSGHLRAFFHELNNAAPAWVPAIVSEALGKSGAGQTVSQFHTIFYDIAKLRWGSGPKQVVNTYTNTQKGSTIKVFDQETMYEEPLYEDSPQTEIIDEFSYEDENYPNSSYEDSDGMAMETLVSDWTKAINQNRYYQNKLGWSQYYNEINDLLLPLSGQQNVSLGEEAFAQAVLAWQQQNGLTADGVIGPNTWSRMKPMLSGQAQPVIVPPDPQSQPLPLPSAAPSVQNIYDFNRWHAQKILDTMNAGIVGQNFHSKDQLEKIVKGEQVLNVNPQASIIQILPIMSHIAEQAANENYREIIFGSFIRPADGNCTGHCLGRCIDINHNQGSFESPGSTQMVIKILQYLLVLPSPFKSSIGFGMPLQGAFFGHRTLTKYKGTDASNLIDSTLQQLVRQLGYVFPDNNNHVHLQIKWQTLPQRETMDEATIAGESPLSSGLDRNAESYAPEFENYTLAYRLDKVSDWVPLLGYKVPDDINNALKPRGMFVQYAHNESYSNDLNVDFYRLRILKYPVVGGITLTASQLIKYIRVNINQLVDTSYCDFYPYSNTIDAPVWKSDDPGGAVLKLDIKGPDNAAVVVSLSKPNGWRFSTVHTPDTGDHPVSGHREFFIAKDSATNGTYFVIKGLDMASTGIAGLGLPFAGEWGFSQADSLWKSMRSKIIQFINANGGSAKEDMTYSERVEWRYVYYRYKNLLEQTFGKGAGSAENSSFFDFQVDAYESVEG